MSAPSYRLTRPGDEKQLRKIWMYAYDEDAACADAFFTTCYQPGSGLTAEADNRLCSAIYWIKGYTLRGCGESDATVTCLYALGTLPEARGRGLGGQTIWHAGAKCYCDGADFVCFLPANKNLAAWYGEILGTRATFFQRVDTIPAGGHIPTGALEQITPEVYAELRECLLEGMPHIEHPTDALRFQEKCCQFGNGGFFRININGASGICTLEAANGKAVLGELLAPACDPADCGRLVMSRTHCHAAEVRVPAFWQTDFGEIRGDFVQIPGGRRFPKSNIPPYWGPSME